MTRWFDDVQRMDSKTLAQLMKMGSKIQKLLKFTYRITLLAGGKKAEKYAMDALALARMHSTANITFHILFSTINIALAWMLMFFRWRLLALHDAA